MIKKTYLLILVLMLLNAGCAGESCLRDYTVTGIVTDNSYNPLPDVEVWSTGQYGETLRTTTGSDGIYSWATTTGRMPLRAPLKFVKAGYKTVETEPFTVIEAGYDVCGSITLRRDAVLQPE